MIIPARIVHGHERDTSFDQSPGQQALLSNVIRVLKVCAWVQGIAFANLLGFLFQIERGLRAFRRDESVSLFEITITRAFRFRLEISKSVHGVDHLATSIESRDIEALVKVKVAYFVG